MSGVAVVTDTTQYIPREIMDRHGIQLVSLYVNWNGRTDRESDLGDYDGFYDHMRTAATLPSTSQPSVGDFLAVWEPLLESGDSLLSIHLSGGISGTVGAAQQARDALIERGIGPERIQVLDSETGCAGHGLMAIAAANAVRRGADLQGATEAARALRGQMKILFAVDTLEYLRRGGRIGAAAALVGTALAVKPLLHVDDGRIVPLEKVRTTGRAIGRLVDLAASAAGSGPVGLAVHHLAAPERAAELATRLDERVPGSSGCLISEVGAVIGAHTGPGVLGVVVLPGGYA
jgi:DegV family protein with EDD domain